MTATAVPWPLDRLSPAARDAAAKASLAAGVSLSSWLAKLIVDSCAAEDIAARDEPQRAREFTRASGDRIAPAQPAAFRATTMVIAPVSAYRPLPTLLSPVQAADRKS
jgi:hypothetical protein